MSRAGRRCHRIRIMNSRSILIGFLASFLCSLSAATAAEENYRCGKGDDVRRIEIRFESEDGDLPCRVIYRPEFESDTIGTVSWRGINDIDICKAQATEVVDRLMKEGYRVAFTGQPALVVEEMETARTDTWLTSITAVLLVTVLTLFVFRWRSHAFLVLAALALGIIWSFGAVFFEYGYLNLITASFISTLVGVGVAYGIHPVSEYELEGAHTSDPVATVRIAAA